MILEDDCPYEAQDDGRLAIDDVRNVYVDQFNLRSNKETTEMRSCTTKRSVPDEFVACRPSGTH